MPRLNREERENLTRPIRTKEIESSKVSQQDFPGGPVVKTLPANAGDMGLTSDPGRFQVPWSN